MYIVVMMTTNFLKKIFVVTALTVTFSVAQDMVTPAIETPAETPAAAAVETSTVETQLKEEIAVRDSVMAVRDSSCSVEKDSLRAALQVEQNKCANWEQSYNTIKRDNEVCAQALRVSIGVNEKRKERSEEERREMQMMGSTSFLGGLGLGMLLFWLIFD